jgi:hypothetical protein
MSRSTIAQGAFARSVFANSVIAGAAAAMALGAGLAAPQSAAAQSYGYGAPQYGGSYYDPCRRDQTQRGVMGALVGGALGAMLGSQTAANHHRTDGSLLGGGLGALAGAYVGNRTAACNSGSYYQGAAPPPPPPQAYAPPPPPPPAYEGPGYSRYGSRYDDDDRWAYGERGERLRIVDRPPSPDGCTLAESPIYMPDGRVQKRFVRVCMDREGRYQVVD